MSEDYAEFIKEQLEEFGEFEPKKMFGGVGFFREGLMFGLLGKGVFHFKVDDTNRADYEAHGMKGFMSSAKKKGMPYYEVPQEILEDKTRMKEWADKSYQIAINSKK